MQADPHYDSYTRITVNTNLDAGKERVIRENFILFGKDLHYAQKI